MKRCVTCKLEKPLSEFHTHKTRGHQASCKTCRKTYNAAHYQKNKASYAASRDRSAKRMRQWFEALKDGPCTDCSGRFPAVCMQWDHLPGTTKVAEVGRLARLGRQAVLDEIKKCELVCANCHAIRTSDRHTDD